MDDLIEFIRRLVGFAKVLDNANHELLALVAKMTSFMLVPSLAVFEKDAVAYSLGSVTGLAQGMFALVAILIGLRMMGSPMRNHGRQVGQLFGSIWHMVLFVVGYYPLLTLVRMLLQRSRDAVVELMGVDPSALEKAITSMTSTPIDPFVNVLQGLVIIVLGFILLVFQLILAIGLFALVFLFPIAVVLRPLGGFFDKAFHALLSGMLVILLSPILITACLLSPIAVARGLPFGNTSWMQLAVTLAAFVVAIILPSWLWKVSYKKSVDVFGKVESTMGSGKVDIGNMPPVRTEDAKRQGAQASESALKAFATTVATGAAVAGASGKGQDVRRSMANIFADGISSAATTMGQPVFGALVQGANSVSRSRQEKHRREVDAARVTHTPPMQQTFVSGHRVPGNFGSSKGVS